MRISQTGVGLSETPFAIRDSRGTGILPFQAWVEGAATFRVLGRVSPEAEWLEVKPAGTADFLETFSWVPYLALEVTSGSGTVHLDIGEA